MKNILNITNGDCAVDVMKQADIAGEILPWRDVLHDGPVPEGLPLEALSQVRADFISSRGWGKRSEVMQEFVARDATLIAFDNYEKVILWFEHDLYDQLQLIQILDWFYQNKKTDTKISMICTDKYLGPLSPEEMKDMFQFETLVTDEQLLLSNKAWSAFRSKSPEGWYNLLNADTTALPFLHGAIIRMLEEYPDFVTGLSRTAWQALTIISKGEKLPGKVFAANQELEDRIYLGDSSFWLILQSFLDSSPALLKLPDGKLLTLPTDPSQELTITSAGLAVLAGKNDWLDIIELDCWIGGVHLKKNNIWRWSSQDKTIIKIDVSKG